MIVSTCTHPQCFRPRPCPIHPPKITPTTARIRDIRIYFTKRWKRFRKRYLEENPFCVHCAKEGKRYVRAVDLDHIIDLRNGGLAYEFSNIQGLCKHHHGIKTARSG